MVGVNLEEAELELGAYPTLGDFFARKLRDGARAIDPSPNSIISPCDGVIAARGTAANGTLIQAKGRDYQLGQLLADESYATQLTDGEYITIYLSPRDYHRVHVPFDAEILGYDFLPGALWPVNPLVASRRDELLSRNERVVIRLRLEGVLDNVPTYAALVMVGAAGVGNMRLGAWATGFKQSAELRPAGERHRVQLEGVSVQRGDELGAFHLGSTVVLVFGRSLDSAASIQLLGEVGQAVRFGEPLGEARLTP
ncbi:MAG: phosphatidylserine decarboxylase [Deltaproteobacteria bacterium]|nr:phosphatidylserine decarboxylase [Deltaproteobacteria bacterium]